MIVNAKELEELLDQLKDAESPSRQDICDWFGIRFEEFPRFAQAGLERK